MLWIDRRQLAAVDPAGDYRRFFVDQRFQIPGQFAHQQRRPLQHLEAEELRGLGVIAGHLQLQANIFADRHQRADILTKGLQRRQPDGEDLLQDSHIQRLFRRVVIEQIGFRYPGAFSHLLQPRTVNTKLRKCLQRGGQDGLLFGADRL